MKKDNFRIVPVDKPHTCSSVAKPLPDHPARTRFVRAQTRCSSRASPPLNPTGWHACCNHWNAPCHSLRTKTKSVTGLLRAGGRRGFSCASSACSHLLVGLLGPAQRDWDRFQCRVAAFYFHRVSLAVQFWRACGCPPQWHPRLPRWQPLAWRWTVSSGWLKEGSFRL